MTREPHHHWLLSKASGGWRGASQYLLKPCTDHMNDTKRPVFAMVQIKDVERMRKLIGERKLELRDAATVWTLLSYLDTYSGRIRVTAVRIAEDLQCQPTDVRASISRLKKQHLLRQVRDRNTGEHYYRLNPWMVQTANGSLLGVAMKEFQEA